MDEDRVRRLAALVLLCSIFLVTSLIEDLSYTMQETSRPHSSGTAKVNVRKVRSLDEMEGRGRRKGDYAHIYEDQQEDEEEEEEEENEREKKINAPDYVKKLKSTKSHAHLRTSSFQLDLYSCLPRFICELHAQGPAEDLTDFERDVLSLFRNHVVLEGPGSPAYPYQVAAHMGQLWAGIEPSPCHSLYPSCPLSRTLLLDLLRNIKSSRRMFY